jgi:hypothetical protein
MINGDLTNEESVFLAKRIQKEAGTEKSAQIRRLYALTVGRLPDDRESTAFSEFPGNLESLCRVMLNSNEFVYVD